MLFIIQTIFTDRPFPNDEMRKTSILSVGKPNG